MCNDTAQFRDYSWPGLLPWDALRRESKSLGSRVSVQDRSHTTQSYTIEEMKLIKRVNNKFRKTKHGKKEEKKGQQQEWVVSNTKS